MLLPSQLNRDRDRMNRERIIKSIRTMLRYAPLALTVAWALRSSATTEHNNDGHPKVAAVRRLRRPAPITESDLGIISPGRTLQGGGFDKKKLIETADSLACNPGVYSQPFSINVSIDQTPVSVPLKTSATAPATAREDAARIRFTTSTRRVLSVQGATKVEAVSALRFHLISRTRRSPRVILGWQT
jgi:hypothetical protein